MTIYCTLTVMKISTTLIKQQIKQLVDKLIKTILSSVNDSSLGFTDELGTLECLGIFVVVFNLAGPIHLHVLKVSLKFEHKRLEISSSMHNQQVISWISRTMVITKATIAITNEHFLCCEYVV